MSTPVFFNRELSWVEFNARVLEEGLDSTVPLLERLKFLSIVSSNFDEFFMVRVATTKRQLRKSDTVRCPSGLSPSGQLDRISARVHELISIQYNCLFNEILPALSDNGIVYVPYKEFSNELQKIAASRFKNDIFFNLTPVRVEEGRTFPFTTNLRIYILFKLRSQKAADENDFSYAVVQIPPGVRRIQWLLEKNGTRYFTLAGDIIFANAARLFHGYDIVDQCRFRITRDADLSVDEERDEDFLEAMEEIIVNRQYSLPVRLEIGTHASEDLKQLLLEATCLGQEDVYYIPGVFDLASCIDLAFTPGFDHLKDEPWPPRLPPVLQEEELSIWDQLKTRDILLHHPYESFDPVVKLVKEAADDPEVLAIKMTLYRTSGDSPIVKALIRAVEEGKQVSVLVELKARFDEERNIGWAEQLQRAGAIVVYGIAHLKVHSKALLIIRQELDGVKRYVHLGTGNYNDKTAKLYTDIALMSSNESLTYDTVLFFNAVTGYSTAPNMNKLVMAPAYLKTKLLQLIEREIQRSTPENPGLIMAKMNSLADEEVIRALYRASCTGIIVKLNVRGVCMLVPGVKDLSENITVVSIIDRFLEHSRIFYFANQGQDEIFLSSADWMPRNLEKRVELMFPVEYPQVKKRLFNILNMVFKDNVKSRRLTETGRYVYDEPEGEQPFRCQEYFYRQARTEEASTDRSEKQEFIVRRTPYSPNK